MNRDEKRPVTLEDLLRLKRAERPAPEFWAQFDRELRAKQLAALVEKRPWWHSLPRVWGGLARYHVPLGATAALAIGVLSLREFRSTPVAPRPAHDGAATTAKITRPTDQSGAGSAPTVTRAELIAPKTSERLSAPAAFQPIAEYVAASHVAASHLAAVASPAAPTAQPDAEAQTETTADRTRELGWRANSDRLIATHVSVSRDGDLLNGRLEPSATRGFESRAVPARPAPVEPLTQITPPSGVRRARLLANALPVAATQPAPASSERNAHRISEDRLYESISRVGARGAGVLVKF
ncbi:MAG: hypothetical protein RLZZ15_3112 [Verrucomicrobiota bacterium]|jgi:hypothetical protein